ncbi:hypothetical protein PMAYCL1PPCAC_21765, partial [Pristionchus mayeri]
IFFKYIFLEASAVITHAASIAGKSGVPSRDWCKVGTTPATYKEASAICEKIGSKLASIHNMQENAFIHDLAVSEGVIDGVFLGASATGPNMEFAWQDGYTWDYENFFPGFPRTNNGNCLVMDTSEKPGQWVNMDCSTKLAFACIQSPPPTEAPVCTGDDYAEGQIIKSPGFPFTSNTPCDFFLTVEQGKHVETQIISLEANECCDSLILYDGYFGGSVLAKLSGSVMNETFITLTSNTMRVSWQPNEGGVPMRGLVMTYHVAGEDSEPVEMENTEF